MTAVKAILQYLGLEIMPLDELLYKNIEFYSIPPFYGHCEEIKYQAQSSSNDAD